MVTESFFTNKNDVAGVRERNFFSHNYPATDTDHVQSDTERSNGEDDIVLFTSNIARVPARRPSAICSLDRHDPERHKSRWIERKQLVGAQEPLLAVSHSSSSSCADGCICACHSAKNSGRWALHFPMLGTLTVSHRGVTQRRTPCSNPRCNSLRSQPQATTRVVRMDVQPSMWLLRATISVFLSFGMPSPELVLRVNKVTDNTDVHSFMNHVLWAIQREDAAGVQHFLQSRLVRADDVWGDPVNGFTPMRLALDRRSGEIARLL